MSSQRSTPLHTGRPGTVRFGHHVGPVGPIRAADHRLRSPMGGFVSPAERDAAFRSFQFIGAVADEFAVGCAVTSTHAGPSAFAYVWRDRRFADVRLRGRGDDTAVFAADPDDGLTTIDTSRGVVALIADGTSKSLRVESAEFDIDLRFDDAAVDVLRLVTPTGPTGWAYVQKVAATPAWGTVAAHGAESDVADLGAQAHHDYTTGFLRAETWWHWACVCGRLADGRSLGLNLSCGTNESGFRENGGWLDGRWFGLDGALFEFDPDAIDRAWRVRATDGRFDLAFEPGHAYSARADTDAMATNFHQLFGRFEGWVTTEDGEHLAIDAMPGFAESQFLRW